MRLRAVIIDDEQTGIDTLKIIIEKHIPDIKIVGESIRARSGIELIEDYKPEIVFLDISMPEMDGFEMLENLNWKNFNLIFTTAHQEYALKALKIGALDYLPKPVDHRDLRITIDKIKLQIAEKKEDSLRFDYSKLNNINPFFLNKLAVSSKDAVEYIDPFEVISLESKSNYTLIQLNDSRSILTPKTLKEFESQLCDANLNFMRVHHSFVINLHKVIRYLKFDETIIMSNNQKIPLAKSRREAFFRWLNP